MAAESLDTTAFLNKSHKNNNENINNINNKNNNNGNYDFGEIEQLALERRIKKSG